VNLLAIEGQGKNVHEAPIRSSATPPRKSCTRQTGHKKRDRISLDLQKPSFRVKLLLTRNKKRVGRAIEFERRKRVTDNRLAGLSGRIGGVGNGSNRQEHAKRTAAQWERVGFETRIRQRCGATS
jgi:hypothetical protein